LALITTNITERREAELARLELTRLQVRLEAHTKLESELRQLLTDFEAQRQACVHAEQSAAVLKAQKVTLEARIAELKDPALPQTRVDGRDSDGYARKTPVHSPQATARRANQSSFTPN
jgi:cell division protein FtsB